MANLTTFSAALQEFYEGTIEMQLAEEAHALELMEKMSVSWAGSQAVVACHIARNTGVGAISDGGNLPAAGSQGLVRLVATAGRLAGRFQLSGPLQASADKGGKNAFAAAVDVEMKGLSENVRNIANRLCFWGGRCKGWINEHKAHAATTSGAGTIAAPASSDGIWEFSGDYQTFTDAGVANNTALTAGASTTWVQVGLFRNDTYDDHPATLTAGGTAAGTAIFVSAVDTSTQRIKLSVVTDDAGGLGAGSTLDTDTGIAKGEGFTLYLKLTQFVLVLPSLDAGLNFGQVVSFANEPIGICGNLGDNTHFLVVRDDTPAVTAADNLQSQILTANAAGDNSRVALALSMFEQVNDSITEKSDLDPDIIIMHPTMRQNYVALLQGVLQVDNREGKAKADGGFGGGLSYGSTPIVTSRHMGRGALLFMLKNKWKFLELKKPGFRDQGGGVLQPLEGSDNVQGVHLWYYEQMCIRPNANAVLCGLNI